MTLGLHGRPEATTVERISALEEIGLVPEHDLGERLETQRGYG